MVEYVFSESVLCICAKISQFWHTHTHTHTQWTEES